MTASESDVTLPSDLHRHLGCLLKAKAGADVTFKVGGGKFAAHRCVLAARSSILVAELFGPMKEKAEVSVRINDMEARVFKAMLKLICEDKLRNNINTSTDATTLALADSMVKEACLKFIARPGSLKAIMASDGFFI